MLIAKECANYGGTITIDNNTFDIAAWSASFSLREASLQIKLVGSIATGFESKYEANVYLPIFTEGKTYFIKKISRKNGIVTLDLIPYTYAKIYDRNTAPRWKDVSSATSFTDIMDAFLGDANISYELQNVSFSGDLDFVKAYIDFHDFASMQAIVSFFASQLGGGWYIDHFRDKLVFTDFNVDNSGYTISTPIRTLESHPEQYFSKILFVFTPSKSQVQVDLTDGSGSLATIEIPFPVDTFDIATITEYAKRMRIGYYSKQLVVHYSDWYNKLANIFAKKATDGVTGETLLIHSISIEANAPNCFITFGGVLM